MHGRRTVLLCVICAMLALTLSSCFSTGTVWDDTIPPEQSARVWFMYFVPKSYNGMDVDAKKFRIATLPAGDAEFSGDIAWSNQGTYVTYIFRSKDANFSCRFEGGEEYIAWVTYERDQETGKRLWGIALYKEKIAAKIGAPDKKNLVAFIPFDPPVLSN